MKTIRCDFSGVYAEEDFLVGEALDFTSLDGTSCYCSEEAAACIRKVLAPFSPHGIHWIDSGDYHYVSLFWLEMIEEPFRLVLFDNHPDDQQTAFGPDVLSCGSWVASARELSNYNESAEAIYISIDKDVLSPNYARTDWDQGTMTLEELTRTIKKLASEYRIIGVDVCGELSISKGATAEDLRINSHTNRIIQELLLNLQD